MEEQKYYFKISPENIYGDLRLVQYTGDTDMYDMTDPCCPILTGETSVTGLDNIGVYTGMTYVLSGGTNGDSLLTGLTISLLFTETAVDMGYYSVFDGAVLQKDVINNFLFSGTTGSPYTYSFYNTSDTEFIKFLSLVTYVVDWGDGSPKVTLTNTSPISHNYPTSNSEYHITMTATSPWGISKITKTITTPFDDVIISNPNGTATFTPAGGNWTGTSFNYDYIFSGDSNTDINDFFSYNYTTIPFLITGYTESTINDLAQYGPKGNLYGGKFKVGVQVTGTTGSVGTVWGPDPNGLYTAYTINQIDYFDYEDFTLFMVYSSGFTQNDLIMTGLTKNEALINVIDQPEVQTNVFIERGKNSALEYIERIGEVDNVGDLEKYGYGFFNVKKDLS
jgi:hypothetical protein